MSSVLSLQGSVNCVIIGEERRWTQIHARAHTLMMSCLWRPLPSSIWRPSMMQDETDHWVQCSCISWEQSQSQPMCTWCFGWGGCFGALVQFLASAPVWCFESYFVLQFVSLPIIAAQIRKCTYWQNCVMKNYNKSCSQHSGFSHR